MSMDRVPNKRQRQTRSDPDPSLNRAARRHDEEWFANRLAVSPREAAAALGVGHDTIYRLLNDGTIRSIKLGSRRLIPTSELRRLLEEAASA
jgi:excisionase family DNA binding protein